MQRYLGGDMSCCTSTRGMIIPQSRIKFTDNYNDQMRQYIAKIKSIKTRETTRNNNENISQNRH